MSRFEPQKFVPANLNFKIKVPQKSRTTRCYYSFVLSSALEDVLDFYNSFAI